MAKLTDGAKRFVGGIRGGVSRENKARKTFRSELSQEERRLLRLFDSIKRSNRAPRMTVKQFLEIWRGLTPGEKTLLLNARRPKKG